MWARGHGQMWGRVFDPSGNITNAIALAGLAALSQALTSASQDSLSSYFEVQYLLGSATRIGLPKRGA